MSAFHDHPVFQPPASSMTENTDEGSLPMRKLVEALWQLYEFPVIVQRVYEQIKDKTNEVASELGIPIPPVEFKFESLNESLGKEATLGLVKFDEPGNIVYLDPQAIILSAQLAGLTLDEKLITVIAHELFHVGQKNDAHFEQARSERYKHYSSIQDSIKLYKYETFRRMGDYAFRGEHLTQTEIDSDKNLKKAVDDVLAESKRHQTAMESLSAVKEGTAEYGAYRVTKWAVQEQLARPKLADQMGHSFTKAWQYTDGFQTISDMVAHPELGKRAVRALHEVTPASYERLPTKGEFTYINGFPEWARRVHKLPVPDKFSLEISPGDIERMAAIAFISRAQTLLGIVVRAASIVTMSQMLYGSAGSNTPTNADTPSVPRPPSTVRSFKPSPYGAFRSMGSPLGPQQRFGLPKRPAGS